MVVVDCFSKYTVFVPILGSCLVEEETRLCYSHMVQYFSSSKDIISDRDTCFSGRFLIILFKLMGLKFKFSVANHPQIDG